MFGSHLTPPFNVALAVVSSFILYQGLKASAVSLITMVLGFL